MATKNQTPDWRGLRKQARVQAARLEKQAAATRLVAVAEDPIDALAPLWDLAAQERHAASARSARLHGRATPQAPAPVSRLLRASRSNSATAATGEWRTMILTALRTGMRHGELIVLRWEDVDLVAGRITVRQNDLGQCLGRATEPKTKKAAFAAS